MDKKKKKKRRGRLLDSRFYRVYFSVLAVTLVCVVIGLIWLNGVVRDYEIAQPVHAAEVVAELFENGDYDTVYTFDASAQELSGGDKAFYVDSLRALTEGKEVAWREGFSADPAAKNYTVTLDGDKFATFTLVHSGETTAHGNPLWQLGSITTHIALKEPEPVEPAQSLACRITVPQGSAVTVDGQPLSDPNLVSTEPLLPEGFLPEGVEGPMMVTYAFAAAGEQPAIAVTGPSGELLDVAASGENTWSCMPTEDTQLKESYSDDIVKLGERIAKYTAKDLSQSSLLAGVASDSPAETVIKKFSNSWAPSHKTSKIVDPVVSQFYVISEECFTCHVEFDFVLTSRRGNDYVYPTAYTFCFIKSRGEGRLYNLTFH